MDRREFASMLASIPFLNKLTLEKLPDETIKKIEPLDEATLLVIRKAQAMTDAFLTGFKDVKFKLLTNHGEFPLTLEKYYIENGIASIELNKFEFKEETKYMAAIADYGNGFSSAFDLNINSIKDSSITVRITLTIAC